MTLTQPLTQQYVLVSQPLLMETCIMLQILPVLTLLTFGGCDSIVYINLTESQEINDTIFQSICAGETFIYDGTVYAYKLIWDSFIH